MKQWTIGDVAARAGVPASTIRYYEEIELLPRAQRLNGRRRYDRAILPRLNIIRLAQEAGFTLDEIHTLVHDFPEDTAPSARWQVMARQKLDELDERLRTIEAMKGILQQTLNCECATLEECATGIEARTTAPENVILRP